MMDLPTFITGVHLGFDNSICAAAASAGHFGTFSAGYERYCYSVKNELAKVLV